MTGSPNGGWAHDVVSVQPGGGPGVAARRAWGRWRRAWLRRCRPGYVATMRALRGGACPDCRHDVVDAHDLCWVQNVCGHRWPAPHARSPFRDRLGLVRLGRPELLAAVGLGGALALLAGLAWSPAAVLGIAPPAFAAWFFRDPERTPPADPDGTAVLAPADGVLDDVRHEAACPWFAGPALRLGTYLSVLDVHVQRAPTAGTACAFAYRRGARVNTAHVGGTDANEQLATTFVTDAGVPVVVHQIAGPLARRICCVLAAGERVAAAQRFGLIKFGSRCEVWLPAAAVHDVAPLGARMRAGTTVLCRLAPRSSG